ncbi:MULTISPECIES: FumA C-terminus/TtdB family hydratase beta subunit [Caproicibacterium]|uniref:FumA C-terminus/TtdB family hydratase beta subunit n=1 Tax=Caproicibacterium argilliputei TaxID=3030016 RepID=A0AA97H1P0_9FIRM|nr:FumA C-terminus/TtdB family hydratase beta subunit [Caproicibacterium argilliputei]WOC31502.1 FumA C-terminus/TtdB family hydratase beta subunit [Caproicibacterium argilliputei]
MNRRQVDAQSMTEQAPLLHAGEQILLSGVIYTARDQAHKRLRALMQAGKPLPFPLEGASIYYAGPTPTPPNLPIGACGPTTSGRMDPYAPDLLDAGLKCMVGKGKRSQAVVDAICRNQAVYLCAIGGAGALAAQCVQSMEVLAFADLGCESVKRLTVRDFPLIVAIDCHGGNLFSTH